ncbi:MAG: DUF222 domain-containing protein, partial [Gordonia sp. (in: high G+C Gram-positive bacteria)]
VAAERTLGEKACEFEPADLTQIGVRLLAHLDPDGQLTDQKDRMRRRRLSLGAQDPQLMAKLSGLLTPMAYAKLSAFFNAWAAPGANNPADDDSPVGAAADADPERLKAAAQRDNRTQSERNHDAFVALLDAALDGGLLGDTHRGMPAHLIIKVTLSELLEQAGFGTTATGAILPLSDVLSAAADSQPWLALFKDGAAQPLYFGRGRRLASRGQRLASFSGEGGERCSAPGCTQPAARTEMHHSDTDWADGGPTDLSNLAPACPQHHRMVGPDPGQYTTGTVTGGKHKGRTWWQLNVAPGMPQNPRLINRIPDLPANFEKHLADVRKEVHQPADTGHHHPTILVVDDTRLPRGTDISYPERPDAA